MGEGAEQAQRIDCLLEEGRNAETILQHTKKQVFFAEKRNWSQCFGDFQVAEGKAELRKQQNLYHRSRIHST